VIWELSCSQESVRRLLCCLLSRCRLVIVGSVISEHLVVEGVDEGVDVFTGIERAHGHRDDFLLARLDLH
jgi:hypothetical protein